MKNVSIAYVLSLLWRSWFWLGIWVFYYLRFTDYAGIGFLEAVMITTSSLGEIPTGAIADVLGKKKAVILAFLLGAIGNILMAFAPNYATLIISIIFMTIGGAFYSGSLEALVYDSLLEEKKTDIYHKVVSRMTSMQNVGAAVAAITGGYLYQVHITLPFILVAVAYIIGMFISFGLTEPHIDSEKYSWKKFISQNKEGFAQLFSTKRIAFLALLFLIPSSFMIATENVINDATAVELGFTSVQLGIFATVMYLFGVFASEHSSWIITRLRSKWIYGLMLVIYVATLLLIPQASLIVGGTLLLLRYCASTIFTNYESVRINAVIDSRYRATTLSTFSLIKNIPYVFAATFIGVAMNNYGAFTFSMYFGILLLGVLLILVVTRKMFTER
ncbi:MFS transporter [Candidatus Woesebacteria bacterium]|nr:MFS transporter [Candidatus Woesebacteria bacterium]